MALSEIQAYNICLRAIGQRTVGSLDTYDPDVAEISNHLADAKRELLTNGYPFNTDKVTLQVDEVSGKIPVSQSLDGETNYLKYYLPLGLRNILTDREGYLWNPDDNSFYTDTITDVWVVVDISDWTSLPDECREAIAYRAAATYAAQVKGPASPDAQYAEQKAVQYMGRFESKYPCDYGQANGINRLLSDYDF